MKVVLSHLRFSHFWYSRFEDLTSLKDGNLIIYVGANTDGADGVDLMTKCPHWWAKPVKTRAKFKCSKAKNEVLA